MRISARIPGRLEKEFYPREEEGSVRTVGALWHLPLNQGSWTIQARINKYVNDIAAQLEQDGYFYSRKGRWSGSQQKVEAKEVWRQWVDGLSIAIGWVRTLYESVRQTGQFAAVRRGAPIAP